jgi:serine/threonine protein kinase/Tol biopolymer transport system component
MKDMLPARVRLGAVEVNLRVGELREGERTVLLQEQPLRILQMLIEHGGELVTRDEIKKKFWPNDTVVEFDHSINAAIKKLRRALDDSADEPQYIATVARRGYRLMVPVEWIAGAEDSPGKVGAEIAGGTGAAVRMQPDPGALTGRTVSHYRVLDIIGGGGMGVVYRAEDLKLGRAVALKFLPEELGSDQQALERFSREARAASSLDHPNICPIHEFGEHEGRPFMVMQLLEGQTLRDRLAVSEGALPLKELLDIGAQVSDGLQAAHERGIIHRDIKPANIFLTDKGVCKVLDFGIAKLLVEAPGGVAVEAPESARVERGFGCDTVSEGPFYPPAAPPEPTLTRTGLAMGTAGYMSPEQVRGEKLDARSDLFSFGLVLYEMATGQRAFNGETAAVVHEAMLHQPQVPAHDLNSKLPLELETIISKALEKDRGARYQTAAEMGTDLKRLHRAAEPMQKPTRYGRGLLFLGAALAIALLGLGLGRRWFKGQPIAPGKTLSERLLTHNPSENRLIGAAISPDGKYLAYTDTKGLHLSVVGTGESHDIPLPEELRTHLQDVTWAPEGEKLLFTADSDAEPHMIWVASVFGGAPRKLRGDGDGPEASPQGSLIAFVSGNEHEIWVMGANGENPHRILTGENERYAALAWSPTGQRLAYIRAQSWAGGTIETLSLDGGAPSVVISDPQLENSGVPGLVWARDGRIIFVSHEVPWENGANLWEVMTDPWTGKASRRATKITNWDGVAPYSPTVSSDAKRLAVVKPHARYDVYVAELRDGGTRLAPPKRLTVSESEDYPSGWMRDSKTILFSSNRTVGKQVFRQQIEQDTAEPLIRGPDDEEGAELSPDGRWILYWSNPPGRDSPATTKRLMRFPALGGSPERVLEARKDDPDYFDCPVRPASSCVFAHWEQGQLIFYALDPVQSRGKELARTTLGAFTDLHYTVSPEGSRMAVASWDQLREQVRIVDFRTGMERNLPLPHGWRIRDLSWTADGNALFAAAGYFIARIELDGTTRVLLNRSRNQWLKYPCPSPDGRYLAFSQATFESNAWLLENF